MSIGMTYNEFWNEDVELVKYYREADELRLKRNNQLAWLQGMYIYEALCDASPLFRFTMKGKVKAEPYAKEPYPITENEVRERKAEEMRLKEERMKAQFRQFVQGMVDKRSEMPTEAQVDKNGR